MNIDKVEEDLNKEPLVIIKKYNYLLSEYFNNSINVFNLKNENYNKFILNKGIETISHVFNNVYLFTEHEELTYKLTEKAFYYYVEFIQQIYNEKNTYLDLSIKEAILFVYKKTLVDLNEVNKKEKNTTNIELIKMLTTLTNSHLYYNVLDENLILNVNSDKINNFFKELDNIYDDLIIVYLHDKKNFKDKIILINEIIIYFQKCRIYNSELIKDIIKNINSIFNKYYINDELNINNLLNNIYNNDFKMNIININKKEIINNLLL